MIDKYTVLAEKLSTNGKSPDSLIDTLKTLSPIEREKVISVLRWIDTNYDLEPNGGSLDFIVDCLLEPAREVTLTGISIWSCFDGVHDHDEINDIPFPTTVRTVPDDIDDDGYPIVTGGLLLDEKYTLQHFTYHY